MIELGVLRFQDMRCQCKPKPKPKPKPPHQPLLLNQVSRAPGSVVESRWLLFGYCLSKAGFSKMFILW